MGVMALISGVTGAEAALVEGFRTFAGAASGAVSGLVLVAIRVKLKGASEMTLAGIVESHGLAPTISDVVHEVND
jgi:hypothetical protein